MKQYICTACGYIHETEGELPDDFKCPLCGAGKDAFVLKEETAKAEETLEKPHTEKELSQMEMSIICSNFARGCEKQYMPEESRALENSQNSSIKSSAAHTIAIPKTEKDSKTKPTEVSNQSSVGNFLYELYFMICNSFQLFCGKYN